jgi:hypothetical protein
MAKKSTKNSRRARTKKEQVSTKKTTPKKQVTAAVESAKPTEPAAKAPAELQVANDQAMVPTRTRMMVSAVLLGVVVVTLIAVAVVTRQQNTAQQQSARSGQDSGRADQILQSGGNVCTNGNSAASTTGSSNPDAVGMILQTNPASDIQTPQTMGGGSDLNTLQGAACY